uniref:Glutamic acid-rich protein-like n=1 Tax=Tanacetum cinerariifolium TaxID=118510 RepID=A0A6L2JIC0_TANCI|nr:hypothetical protein [Tanacetum cinerariifolium]
MGYEKPSTKLTFYKAFFSSQWKFSIHTILQSLSAKRTSWNEFSIAMASVVICLSKGQRFNFSKYIFDSLVRNVDSSSKFYMVGKGFSGVETPLFEGMIADSQPADKELGAEQVQVDAVALAAVVETVVENVSHDADAEFPTQLQHVLNVCSALSKRVENLETDTAAQKLLIVKLKARVKKLEIANKIKSSKLRRLRKVGTSRRVESSDGMEDVFNQGRMFDDIDMNEGIELVKDTEVAESERRHADAKQVEKQAEIYNIDLDHSLKVLNMQEDDSKVQEVVEVVTTAKLITEVTAAALQVSTVSTTIPAVSATVPAAKPSIPAAYTKRRKGVIIRDPEEELSKLITEELSLKTSAETLKVKDKGKGIMIEALKPMKKKDQIELDAKYARKLHEEVNKDDADFNKDVDWDAAMEHVNQKSSKNPQYIKRYHGMKKRSQTESEARKNMMIYLKNTAGYKMDFFKGMSYADICPIFQARFDENIRKLNEEAQEAEALKKQLEIVHDEDDDVFTEATPIGRKTMFKKTDGQDAIWRNQQSLYGQALVKSWKLLTSCGVHIISLTTTNFILLVERRYPLSKFTLEQLVNVSNIDAARLKLKLFKNIAAAADDVKR